MGEYLHGEAPVKNITGLTDRFGAELAVGDFVLIDGSAISLGVVSRFTKKKVGIVCVQRYRTYNSVGWTCKHREVLFNNVLRLIKVDRMLIDLWPDAGMLAEVREIAIAIKERENGN